MIAFTVQLFGLNFFLHSTPISTIPLNEILKSNASTLHTFSHHLSVYLLCSLNLSTSAKTSNNGIVRYCIVLQTFVFHFLKHRGGSKAAVEYAVEFENASEHLDSIERALFSQFHKNDVGEYTDERSRRIDEELRARIEQLSQPVPGTDDVPEVDTSQVFLDVAGAPKKKRLFGTGCLGRMLMRSASSSAPPPSPAASSVDAETIARLERQIAEDRTAREAMAATLMRQQEMLSQLLERMGGAPPPPPPSDSAA